MKNIFNLTIAISIASFTIPSINAGKVNGPDKGANFGSPYYEGQMDGTVATPLFASAADVLAAYDNGDLELVRMPETDFVCSVRKNG
ncbi:MAG: hypothetical protein VYC82_03860 [Verrucomicrobiota bacterium]|nr:hypothetical protein [Verrucomicrobiota bacterium]